MSFSTEEKNKIRNLIASEFGYDPENVVEYEPSFEGEIVFKSGSNFFSIFESDEKANEFYEEAFLKKASSEPQEIIKTFDHELGKDQWLNFISRESLSNVLMTTVDSINTSKMKPDSDVIRKIKETPFSVLRSFFNMSNKFDVDKFYRILLTAIDRSIYEKTAKAVKKQAEIFTFKLPEDKRVTVWKW